MNEIEFRTTKELDSDEEAFNKAAWDEADKEYYGKTADQLGWVKKYSYIVARKSGQLAGVLKYKYSAGVCHVSKLVVSEEMRGSGVGKALMEECEKQAKDLKCHKVELTTREEWNAHEFYKSIGYEDVATLKNHYHKLDFVLMAKQI